ncbi:MAG: autotransporter outer membrane beta-barrel domain-containing protein [Puniceicoccales bacterium]|jgi:outer membrane autotransporter protein|nr:autotransporter outer membrane beta-barrel domain-containing protein [Puniceicoccales bacterium]
MTKNFNSKKYQAILRWLIGAFVALNGVTPSSAFPEEEATLRPNQISISSLFSDRIFSDRTLEEEAAECHPFFVTVFPAFNEFARRVDDQTIKDETLLIEAWKKFKREWDDNASQSGGGSSDPKQIGNGKTSDPSDHSPEIGTSEAPNEKELGKEQPHGAMQVRERGVELSSGDEMLLSDPFSSEDMPGEPVIFRSAPLNLGDDDVSETDLSLEQAFIARNNARLVQDTIFSEFYQQLGGDGRFSAAKDAPRLRKLEVGKEKSLWGRVICAQNHAKAQNPHKNKIFVGTIGYNFINSDSKIFGPFVSFSNVDTDFSGKNEGTNSRQNSLYCGIYGLVQFNKFMLSGSSILGHAHFHCDQNLKNIYADAPGQRAHSRYNGVAFFNKLSLAYMLKNKNFLLGPEVSVYTDWIKQKAHNSEIGGEILLKHNRTKDFYTSCEIGLRCLGTEGCGRVYPDIFIGYEFDIHRRNTSLRVISQHPIEAGENRRKDCFAVKVKLAFGLNDKLSANIGYLGNHGRCFHLNALAIGMDCNF